MNAITYAPAVISGAPAFMPETFQLVMTDHPAWHATAQGCYRVFALPDHGQWLVTIQAGELVSRPLTAGSDQLQPDVFRLPESVVIDAPELFKALTALGTVARFRTPDLWEAIATAIIRQVIRAAHAKRLYQDFCASHGQRISAVDGDGYALFPDAGTVLGLGDEQFAAVGLTFKRGPLRAAAETYLKYEQHWRDLPPAALGRVLQQVPRIGAWTAGAAVADFTNDFTYYPYADLAVRTWARRAAPSYRWPDDEQSFGRLWQALAGDHLASLTFLTLASGSHHGDTR
jgi:DNA-3-methyladenine glycosylase II